MSLLVLPNFERVCCKLDNLLCILMAFLNFEMSRKGKIGNKKCWCTGSVSTLAGR